MNPLSDKASGCAVFGRASLQRVIPFENISRARRTGTSKSKDIGRFSQFNSKKERLRERQVGGGTK
jgi:hypothetical protein